MAQKHYECEYSTYVVVSLCEKLAKYRLPLMTSKFKNFAWTCHTITHITSKEIFIVFVQLWHSAHHFFDLNV